MGEIATPATRGVWGPATRHFFAMKRERREWARISRHTYSAGMSYDDLTEVWLDEEPGRHQQFKDAEAAHKVEHSVRVLAFKMKWDGWMERFRETGR